MAKSKAAPPSTDPLLDFRNFLFIIWAHLNLGPPTRRQYQIAHYLQHGPRRKIVMAFRGVGKSWITAAYVLWVLYCNPQMKILVVSASKGRAANFTKFCMQLLREVPQLQHLTPRNDQRQSVEEFDVGPATADQNASVRSVGITGQLTGSRADLIVADDVEVPKNSATQAMRDKLAELVKEFDALLKPGGKVTYLGTPQTEGSLYFVLGARDYSIRIWPSEYPDPPTLEKYGSYLAPDILEDMKAGSKAGESTEPSRFPLSDLDERRISYGKAGYALQFLLLPGLSDLERYPLRLRDLLVANLNPELAPERLIWGPTPELVWNDLPNLGMTSDRMYRPVELPNKPAYLPYVNVVMAVDPSGRGKDETAYCVVGCVNSTLYVLEAGGFKDGYSEDTLQGLVAVALRNNVRLILTEANFGDGMFTKILTPVVIRAYQAVGKHCGIEEVKHSVQKEKRIIDTLEPVMATHRLVFNASVIQKDFDSIQAYPSEVRYDYSLIRQMTRITREKGALNQDDRLDALSIGVAYWVEHMAKDQDRQVELRRQSELDKEIERFRREAYRQNGPPKVAKFQIGGDLHATIPIGMSRPYSPRSPKRGVS